MTFKEFPDIKVDLSRFNSTNPYYIGTLAISFNPPHSTFAHAVAMPVESTGLFLGGTIRSYADCHRYLERDGKLDLTEEQCLELMLKDMFPNAWFHAVVLNEENSNKVDSVLTQEEEVRRFLGKESEEDGEEVPLDPKLLERVLFVPGERYSKDTWGFTYEPVALEKVAPYRLPVDAIPAYTNVIEGLSTVSAIMRGGNQPDLAYLNNLFKRMSEPRLKALLEPFIERKYLETGKHNQSTLRTYMERYGFKVPEQ